MTDREIKRVGHAWLVPRKQLPGECRLIPKTRQERDIDIDGLAGLAPALERQAADNLESPSTRPAAILEIGGGAIDLKHGRVPS